MRRLPTLAEMNAKPRAQAKPDRFARQAKEKGAARKHRLERDLHRMKIYRLDEGKCRRCWRKVYLRLKDAPTALAVGHVDEFVSRAHGGDDLEETNTILFCAECHLAGKHGKLFDVVALDLVRLMRGPVEFPPHVEKSAPWNTIHADVAYETARLNMHARRK